MKDNKTITLSDIAEVLNLSPTVISLVLNNKSRKYRISEEVEKKVREKALEMGYRPNRLAQSLRTGKTRTIGLIVADISNPFFSKIARQIENAASEHDYQVMFASSDESLVKFGKLVQLFVDKQVDGVIVAPVANSQFEVMNFVNARIPVVLIDRNLSDMPVSCVQIDNVSAAYQLTRYLIDSRSCRRIGFITVGEANLNFQERLQGYKDALRDSGIALNKSLIYETHFKDFEKSLRNGVDHLLTQKVEALFFASNRIGTQSLLYLKEKNISIPNDLFVAGFDNPDEYKLASIPVSCVEQPIEGLAVRSLELLFEQIEHADMPVETVMLAPKLILK